MVSFDPPFDHVQSSQCSAADLEGMGTQLHGCADLRALHCCAFSLSDHSWACMLYDREFTNVVRPRELGQDMLLWFSFAECQG